MIPAELAIARFRRDLAFGTALKGLLLAAALLAVFAQTIFTQLAAAPSVALAAIGILWLVLSYHSMKNTRLAALSPALIASGQYEQAELHIDQALRSFTLFRAAKFRTLHYLAVLRQAEKRHAEAALLCHALLAQRLGGAPDLQRSARLILADCALELGDLPATYHALTELYQQRLALSEALDLQAIQTDYLSRIGAWREMVRDIGRKVQLAELMPTAKSARTQALQALACRKTGQTAWESYLRRRVELLADVGELSGSQPLLLELWDTATTDAGGAR